MERKWYKNGTEAPTFVETENGTLYNYNSDANEEMLRADGYLPENEVDKVCTSCTQKVTQRQLRLALLTKSITAEMVEGVINQLPEPARSGALIEFNYASYYDRSNPLINQLGGVFKLSEEDLNEIFNLAGTL